MPRVFNPVDISKEEKEVRKDYFDRHTPVDFYIVPGPVTMNLSAMSVCTKHGLWQSESREVSIRKA